MSGQVKGVDWHADDYDQTAPLDAPWLYPEGDPDELPEPYRSDPDGPDGPTES